MTIAPLGTNAYHGIQRGMQGLRRAATQVAKQGAAGDG